MKLDLIKTGFKRTEILREIPHEILNDLEIGLLNTWKRQSKITEPTLKSVIHELLEEQDKDSVKSLATALSGAIVLDHAQTELALFKARTEATRKVVEKLYVLGAEGPNKDVEILHARLEELRKERGVQMQLPVNAMQWDKLQKAEEEEMWTHIKWLTENEVPIKKKVLYSFIAMTNGGKTVLKTWFSHHMIRAGYNVLYLAQEEPYSDTIRRIYQTTIGITETKYKELTKDGFEIVGKQYAELAKERGYGNFYAVEWPGVEIKYISDYLKRHKEEYDEDIDVVVVDYGKLVESNSSKKNAQEWERVGMIFKDLKQMAMQSNVAVVTSIQLNREASKSMIEKGKVPDLYDVAGAYEATHHVNYAFTVMLKQTSTEGLDIDYDNPERIVGNYVLTVQKQKYGRLRKGDQAVFQWKADHSMDWFDMTNIEIPTIDENTAF